MCIIFHAVKQGWLATNEDDHDFALRSLPPVDTLIDQYPDIYSAVRGYRTAGILARLCETEDYEDFDFRSLVEEDLFTSDFDSANFTSIPHSKNDELLAQAMVASLGAYHIGNDMVFIEMIEVLLDSVRIKQEPAPRDSTAKKPKH